MPKRFLAVLIGCVIAVSAYAKDYEIKGNAGSYVVDVKFDRSVPAKGSNQMEISVLDAASKQVTDATVVVDYSMPTLPGKPSMMSYTTRATSDGKKYKVTLDLSMAGEWNFVVNVTRGGKTEAMTFSLVVR